MTFVNPGFFGHTTITNENLVTGHPGQNSIAVGDGDIAAGDGTTVLNEATASGTTGDGLTSSLTTDGGITWNSGNFSYSNAGAANYQPMWSAYNGTFTFEVGTPKKAKLDHPPIEAPKLVTRRILNMAEEGWVVK